MRKRPDRLFLGAAFDREHALVTGLHQSGPRKVEHWLAHLVNSRRTFLKLVQKARTFDEKQAQALIKDRNYAALDQMVLEHLMGK